MEIFFLIGANVNKSELIAVISEKTQLTKAQADTALTAAFTAISEVLMKQDKIIIPGFGTFSTIVRNARKGRNPSTGKEMTIPQSIVAHFKPATQLKDSVNASNKE